MATSAPSSRHTCTFVDPPAVAKTRPQAVAELDGGRAHPTGPGVHERTSARLSSGSAAGRAGGLAGDGRPAASSLGNESGTGSAPEAWTTPRPANPPPSAGRASTRVPGVGEDASPTSSTTPPTSSPGVIGSGASLVLPLEQQDVGEVQARPDPHDHLARSVPRDVLEPEESIGSPSSWAHRCAPGPVSSRGGWANWGPWQYSVTCVVWDERIIRARVRPGRVRRRSSG